MIQQSEGGERGADKQLKRPGMVPVFFSAPCLKVRMVSVNVASSSRMIFHITKKIAERKATFS